MCKRLLLCVKRQLFAGSASLFVSPIFPRASVRGKENALLLQRSRKKSKRPALQIGRGHLPLTARGEIGQPLLFQKLLEGRASTTWALGSAAPFLALLFMLSTLLSLALALSFCLVWQPVPSLGSSLTSGGFLLCLQ